MQLFLCDIPTWACGIVLTKKKKLQLHYVITFGMFSLRMPVFQCKYNITFFFIETDIIVNLKSVCEYNGVN